MNAPSSSLVAVIATHAAINDSVAQDFAYSFYEQLIEHGQSLEESRLRAALHSQTKHGDQGLCQDRSARKGDWTPPPPLDHAQPNVPWILRTRTLANRHLTWEQMIADVHTQELPYWIDRYRQQVQRDWSIKWRVGEETKREANLEANQVTNQEVLQENIEEFFLDQGLRWLQPLPFRRASDDLTEFVRELTQRRRRASTGMSSAGGAAGPANDADNEAQQRWLEIDRQQLIAGEVTTAAGTSYRLQRLVLSTDAGVGKSSNLEWLHREINRPATSDGLTAANQLAILIRLGELNAQAVATADDAWLEMQIVNAWQKQVSAAAEESRSREAALEKSPANKVPVEKKLAPIPALAMVRQMRAAGRLVLLIDQLDQAQDTVIQAVARGLSQPDWNTCRVIIAGRPYALQQNKTGLFAVPRNESQRWHFVQIEEFTEAQQQSYLGTTAQGESRWKLIPADVREILGTPRVLYYMRYKLTDKELETLRSASDVYEKATWHLIREGLAQSAFARQLGRGQQADQPNLDLNDAINLAYQFLGGLAFLMLSTSHDDAGPNFSKVSGEELRQLKDQLFLRLQPTRYTTGDRAEFSRDVDRIRAMNMGVQWGIVDSEMNQELLWRNRSLQEFMVARWLSAYAAPTDAADLPLYLPHDPATDAYYWIWRFTAEMPDRARVSQTWLQSISQLYQPGDGTTGGTRRSTEMIYRSWHRLEGYATKGAGPARDIRQKFLSEFAGLLTSADVARRETAREITQNFQAIAAGAFEMGSPDDQQTMPEFAKKFWTKVLAEGQAAIAAATSEEETATRLRECVEQQDLPRFVFAP
ncbi:MAG: hypothetical protein ACKOU6_15005, partial [Planctomycetota bacterium]